LDFPVELLVALRLLKLLSAMTLAAGTVGAFLPEALSDRQRAVYFIAGPGWGLSMALGFVLTWMRGVSLLSGWVLAAMVIAIVQIQVLLFAVGTDGRRRAGPASLALGLLIAIVVLMVYQPG
jgi:hypothetical protein